MPVEINNEKSLVAEKKQKTKRKKPKKKVWNIEGSNILWGHREWRMIVEEPAFDQSYILTTSKVLKRCGVKTKKKNSRIECDYKTAEDDKKQMVTRVSVTAADTTR